MVQILFLVLVAVILIAVLMVRSAARTNPAGVIRFARLAGIVAIMVVLAVLALRGRLNTALLLAPMLLPLLVRWRALRQRMRAARGPTPGQHSDVQTRFLRMELDHDTGEMSGEVLEGRFRGRTLTDLGLEDLVELWFEVGRADEQSAAVLEAYLDRAHGDRWRDLADQRSRAQAPDADSGGHMTRDEALEILGLGADATAAEIKVAHRRLMQKMHPDHGGSTYLAAKINQAKDFLLDET